MKAMKKPNSKTKWMTRAVAASLFGVVTTFQACGPGILSKKESASNDGIFVQGPDATMQAVDGAKTSAVIHSENVLTSLVSVAGTGQPSNATRNLYNTVRGMIPESGKVDSVNGPMMMAVTNLAGSVCWDLVLQEKAIANVSQRRIFGQVDFTRGPASVSSAAHDDVIRRLARSAWGRNESDEERSLIKSAVTSGFTSATAADTDRAMLFTCTAILSSQDSLAR